MDHCEVCGIDRQFCVHGLGERTTRAAAAARELLVSPAHVAHFAGCPHKGGHTDYSRWGTVGDAGGAWQRLGNGEVLVSNGGAQPGLKADTRCLDCVAHRPW